MNNLNQEKEIFMEMLNLMKLQNNRLDGFNTRILSCNLWTLIALIWCIVLSFRILSGGV
jgi:hypothetical protein